MDSISRLLRNVHELESGLISRYKITYRYIFVPNNRAVEKQYKKLLKQMSKNPVWTMEQIKKRFKLRTDRLGRDYLISFIGSVQCMDVEKIPILPIIDNGKGQELFTVPLVNCKKCQHYVATDKSKPYCRLYKENNKDMLQSMMKKVANDTNRLLSGGEV